MLSALEIKAAKTAVLTSVLTLTVTFVAGENLLAAHRETRGSKTIDRVRGDRCPRPIFFCKELRALPRQGRRRRRRRPKLAKNKDQSGPG
jgi:hypothetical protein